MNYAELVLTSDTRGLLKAKRDLKGVRDEGARTERGVTGSMGKVDRSFDKVGSSARRMVGAAAAAAASIASVGAALRSADQFTAMQNGLRGMGMSAAEAAASLDSIAGIAQRTRAPLEATASLYQRISMASQELGASQQEVLRFTENVGLALGASGAAAGQASGALLQLSQAMSGGTVRAEEFNSILEGAFPIALAAARGIDEAGGSVGRLRALVIEGKISSEEFFDAILSQTDALQTAFGETIPTMSQAVTVLGGGVTMLIGRLNEATGVTDGIATAIMGMGNAAFSAAAFVTDNMDAVGATFNDIQGVVIAAAGALTASYIPAAYGAVTATAAWVASLVTLKGALLATGVGALVVGAGLLIGKFFDLVDATGSWGAALSALGSLAKGVWQGISTSAQAIAPAVNSVWQSIVSGFYAAMSKIQERWAGLLSNMAVNASSIPFFGEELAGQLNTAVGQAIDNMGKYDAAAQDAASASARLNAEAQGLVTEGWAQAGQAAADLRVILDTTRDGTDDTTEATTAYNEALGEVPDAAGGAAKATKAATAETKKFADEIERLEDAADPTRKFVREMEKLDKLRALENGLSDGAYAQGVRDLNEELVNSTPLLSDVNDAFGQMVDYMFDGFKDGMRGILDIFTSTLKSMVAAAIKNRITIGIGAAVTGGAGAAAAGQGGGILSQAGSLLGMGGGGGLLSGVSSGLMGVLGGGGLGSSFANLGGMLSGSVGITGGAIGAALPALGVIAAPFAIASFFKSTKEVLGNGIAIQMEGAVAELQTFEKSVKRSGWGTMSSGFKRDFERLADEGVQGALQARLNATMDTLGQFGFSTDLSGVQYDHFMPTGATSAEDMEQLVNHALDAAIGHVSGDRFREFSRAGEGLAETLSRLSASFNSVNSALSMLGDDLLPISVDGAAAAAALVDLSGGLEAFGSKTAFVFQNFMTDQEQLNFATQQLGAAFQSMNMALPETHAQFRALMDAQNLSTEAGRQMYAALLDVAPLFVEVKGTAQDAAGALAQVAEQNSAVTSAMSDLRAAIAAEVSPLQDQLRLAQDAMRESESVASALRRSLRNMRMESQQGTVRASAQATLRSMLSSGDRVRDTEAFRDALAVVQEPSENLFGSFVEYQRDFFRTASVISSLETKADRQLSADQRAAMGIETQISQLNALIGQYDTQISATMSVEQAVRAVESAISALETPGVSAAAGGGSTDTTATREAAYLAANADVAAAVAAGMFSSGAEHFALHGQFEDRPAFANGGMHSGGLRLVGERGPELEATGPARIYSARQTKEMMHDDVLRKEVREMKEYMRELVKTNLKQERSLKEIEFQGEST